VFVGFSNIMMRYVRTISDSVRAKHAISIGILLVVLGSQPSYAQQAQSTQQTQSQSEQLTQQQTNDKIRQLASLAQAAPRDTPVGAGDLLHIEVFDVPELSRDVRVSDTGDISYPLIPDKIQAAGSTTFQLEQKMAQLLIQNGLVSHPQVSVFIKEQQSQPVSVVGSVNRPSVFQIVRPTTLLEILTQAGGIADNAGNVVIITRADHPAVGKPDSAAAADTQPQTITIRLQDLLESGNPAFNIQIYGGDVVSIPAGGIVYVVGGGTAQPGGYVLQNHGEQITVLKAVALARGLNGFAKPNRAVIMRNNPVTGQKDVIPVKIKDIENQKIDDVKMNSNDILYIPDSVGLKVLAKGSEAALQIGTGVAIYRSY
jgi:polysaccharide biosynthesis/export protein